MPPAVLDADRVAERFVDAGVSEVWIFGSLAQRDATEDSDIDLVAVYEDLDYTQRWDRNRRYLDRISAYLDEHELASGNLRASPSPLAAKEDLAPPRPRTEH